MGKCGPTISLETQKNQRNRFSFGSINSISRETSLEKVPSEIKMSMQFVGLCGYPAVGKSEVQKVLQDLYGFQIIDDAENLREAAKVLYGLEDWHVATQEGKSTILHLGDRRVTVRQVLGELGNHLEKSDPYHMPRHAVAKALAGNPQGLFSLGSVRKDQGCFLKSSHEALIIEVTREGCAARGDFDEYDRSCLDFSLENFFDEGDPKGSKARLVEAVREMLDPVFARSDGTIIAAAG
jgi:hypothetical protein